MASAAAADEVTRANVRYHDLAAARYDAKWGIDYGPVARRQVIDKLSRALGRPPGRFARALEVGAGTGYFTLNLARAGILEHAVATDVSAGMLAQLEASAGRLGVEVGTARCEAAALPFPDASFDLVFGHAVLHHLPDLERAFAEFRRVLRPGGTLAFCGEPSRFGDRLASVPKRAAIAVAPAWRLLVGAVPRTPPARANQDRDAPAVSAEEGALEPLVDRHTFTPATLAAYARGAGLGSVRVAGEELASALFGWANRTLESTAEPGELPWLWRLYAFRGYLALQRLDRILLEPRLPAALFYNLLVSARRPA